MKPKISIVLSSHNQAKYLSTAINSILNQSFKDYEFIIVNDGSDDSTAQLLQQLTDPRIILINHRRRQGLAKSLNQAISQSRGEYIARMDADDIAHKTRLKVQFEFLNQHPHIAVCGTAANLINLQGKKIGSKHYPSLITKPVLIRYNPLIHPSVMMRKSALPPQPYDQNFNGAEDYHLWLRLGSKYQLANIDELLLDYRINPQGISWGSLKHTELQAIKARFKALSGYNYPLWLSVFLIKPILSYTIPAWIKKLLFNIR